MTIMRKIKFAVVFSLLFVLVSIGKNFLHVSFKNIYKNIVYLDKTYTYAVEKLSDNELMSVGSLEFKNIFNPDQFGIHIVSFNNVGSDSTVIPIISTYKATNVRYDKWKDLIFFSGVTSYGFNFSGHISLCRETISITHFEITINGIAKLLIRPLSNEGEALKQKYLPKVELGIRLSE